MSDPNLIFFADVEINLIVILTRDSEFQLCQLQISSCMTEIQAKFRVSGIKSKDFIWFRCKKANNTRQFVRTKNTIMHLNF